MVAFFTIQLQATLADVIASQHRLDFSDGVGLPDLEIGQLGVGVGDEVIHQLIEQCAGAGRLDLRFLAERVAVAGEDQIAQLDKNSCATVAVFILAVQQDALDRTSSGAGLGAVDVLFDLEIEGQLDVEPLAFGQPDQRATTGIHAAKDALGVREYFVVVAERGNYFQCELMIGVLPGGAVEQAIDLVVSFGVLVTYLGELAEEVVVNHLAQELGLFMSGDGHMPDFACDITFFVGQEEPQIAVAADEPLLFKTRQAFLYAALECQLVGVDLIDAKCAEVIDVGLDDVRDVADQEHGLEQADIKGFQRRIVGGLINRELGAGIDETFDGGIKVIEGHERIKPPVGIALCRRLKGIEQGTFALGKVLAGSADLADGFENLLEQGELVGRERVCRHELRRILVAPHADRVADEGQLVVDDVALFLEAVTQGEMGSFRLGQQALADDFIGVGAGQRQPGMEAPLNLGEILRLGFVGFADGGVNVFLTGDDDPCPALAQRPKLLGDGLQRQHQLSVVADELTDFIDKEDDPVAGGLGIEVVAD